MAYADLRAPEELLRDMLVECQTWRAIVADPQATWDELAAILDAGTVAAGSAADAIVYGAFAEVPDDPRFRQRPRANIRQLEDDAWERDSSTGFSFDGSLFLAIDLDIPEAFRTDISAAILDARHKAIAIETDLVGLARAAGRVDFTRIQSHPAGLADPKLNGGDQFEILEWSFSYEGAA